MVTEEVKLLKTLVSDLEKELKTKGKRKRFILSELRKGDGNMKNSALKWLFQY